MDGLDFKETMLKILKLILYNLKTNIKYSCHRNPD